MQSRKLDSLTGLRFIATSMVYICHVRNLESYDSWPFYYWGPNGVILFFTLSGFVICHTYFGRFNNEFNGNLRPYFVARIARIFPMHYLVLFMVMVMAIFLGLGQDNHSKITAIPFQLTLTQSWFWSDTLAYSFNGVAWSLSVEFFFYLIFPFVFFTILKRFNKVFNLIILGVLAYLIMISYLLFLNVTLDGSILKAPSNQLNTLIYLNPLPHLSEFFLGCIAARVIVLKKSQSVNKVLASIIAGICLFLVLVNIYQPLFPLFKLGNLNGPLFAFIIYYLARYNSLVTRILSTKLAIILGEASFVFYLIHEQIVNLLKPILLLDYSKITTWLTMLVIYCLIFAISIGLNKFVESPLRKLIVSALSKRDRINPPLKPLIQPNTPNR